MVLKNLYDALHCMSYFLISTSITDLSILQEHILLVFLLLYSKWLKLDQGQGKICNFLKSEKFSKFSLSHIGKNKWKLWWKIFFWISWYIKELWGTKFYVLLCSKITSFSPSEGEFSEKLGIISKVKIFQNLSYYILEMINKNYHKQYIFGYHDGLKIHGAPIKLLTKIILTSCEKKLF